jgi:hypothetical protein
VRNAIPGSRRPSYPAPESRFPAAGREPRFWSPEPKAGKQSPGLKNDRFHRRPGYNRPCRLVAGASTRAAVRRRPSFSIEVVRPRVSILGLLRGTCCPGPAHFRLPGILNLLAPGGSGALSGQLPAFQRYTCHGRLVAGQVRERAASAGSWRRPFSIEATLHEVTILGTGLLLRGTCCHGSGPGR